MKKGNKETSDDENERMKRTDESRGGRKCEERMEGKEVTQEYRKGLKVKE